MRHDLGRHEMPHRATGAIDCAAETLTLASVSAAPARFGRNVQRRAAACDPPAPRQASLASPDGHRANAGVSKTRARMERQDIGHTILDHRQQYAGPRGIIFTPLTWAHGVETTSPARTIGNAVAAQPRCRRRAGLPSVPQLRRFRHTVPFETRNGASKNR